MRRMMSGMVVVSLVAVSCGSGSNEPESSGVATTADGSLVIEGAGLTMYPSFDPSIERYGIRTGDEAPSTIDVVADFGDARVTVNGSATDSGTTTLTDVAPGDEIDVEVDGGDGPTVFSFVYLPVGFPEIEVQKSGDVAEGYNFLTLRRIADPVVWETVVDENGVPVHVFATDLPSSNLERQPNGTYSVARQFNEEGQPNHEIVVLDADFRQIDAVRNLNLRNTDDHDAILRADGGRVLLAYEREAQDDAPSGERWHSDIEVVGPDGEVTFEWSSEDHVPYTDNLTPNDIDYAHVNSVFETADGNLLASFRNTSQVMKIERPSGDVLWRLGGRSNDFTFVDDPFGGPCAQHDAQELPNGNILLFDNGSQADEAFLPNAGDMCPNPADPDGPTVARPSSRAVEYEIDEEAMTATLVWSHERDDSVYGAFTGSAQRLDNGNTLVSWGTTTIGSTPSAVIVTEVDDSGDTVWELSALGADGNGDYFSYRAYRFPLLSDT